MVRAYVESLLERLTGVERLVPDGDGDYPVRYLSALYYVRLVGDPDPVVQVFSVAVADVEPTPGLLEELNRLNSRLRFARTFWVDGQVLIEFDLLGETLEPRGFDRACGLVATVTDEVAADLAAQFGGRTAFEDSKDDDFRAPENLTGLYL